MDDSYNLIKLIKEGLKEGGERSGEYESTKPLKVAEIMEIVHTAQTVAIMERLTPYIVRREHLAHDAGIEIGKKIALGDIEPEEEG